MPTPRPNEDEEDYVERCVPVVLKEGTAKNQKQAVAICYSMFREHHKRNPEKPKSKYDLDD